ncbi:MAG: phosphate ABC transporter ATP-binding protein [Ignavibacteriae bacterium]|nr:phosphate ABC transporter ATP-binding protein [Ignavibacteriota bacterium]MCB0723415.1 phosphate ABC transporter ATP-binding protein [Ignavibacteriota bacterium]MCB9243261.1 phosphate ABC transporter ATP-binding protein [Ignavibacteriales bacterium]
MVETEEDIVMEIAGEEEEKHGGKFAVITRDLTVSFKDRPAIKRISMKIKHGTVTAIIGPSGCGKSTFLRALNNMHELTPKCKVTGDIIVLDKDIRDYEMTDLRKKVGMVFQKANPFPTMSIYENVVSGLVFNKRYKRSYLDEQVEKCLTLAGLWDEVKDRLKVSGMSLSGGQQQRLCIARTIAVNPEIILMDEPTSALDPISTQKVEELIFNLKSNYTIIIVTHNMQQAARVSDSTAFFFLGDLIEYSKTQKVFTNPNETLTEEYVTGKFG